MSFIPSALLQAVASGDADAVRALIADGADANATNDGGQTLLILAIVSGQNHLLQLLLKAGGDPLVRDNTGLNSIDWAERKGRNDLVQILIGFDNSNSSVELETSNLTAEARQAQEELQPSRGLSSTEKSLKFLAGLRQRLEEKAQQVRTAEDPGFKQEMLEAKEESVAPTAQVSGTLTEPKEASGLELPAEALPSTTEPPVKTSSRKRCPQCNRIYNSELLAYCAYHVVPLVNADDPIVIPKSKEPSILLWVLILITLGAAAFAGLFLTNLVLKNYSAAGPTSPVQPLASTLKGIPVAGKELAGKELLLVDAEVPLNQVSQPTTIIVRVKVDNEGHVASASGSSGDDRVLRDAALAAAKKSTFSGEKLRSRATQGTISYTFNP